MKMFLIVLLLSLICISGCLENYSSSFEKEYRQLERETKYYTEKDFYDADKRSANDKRLMTVGDRIATVAQEAQKERRAQTVPESDYYFQVYPNKKGSYSYNEYNEVWSDSYPLKSYKETQRLWKKPKKYRPEEYVGIPDDGMVTEQAIAAAEAAALKAEQEAAASVDSDEIYE